MSLATCWSCLSSSPRVSSSTDFATALFKVLSLSFEGLGENVQLLLHRAGVGLKTLGELLQGHVRLVLQITDKLFLEVRAILVESTTQLGDLAIRA